MKKISLLLLLVVVLLTGCSFEKEIVTEIPDESQQEKNINTIIIEKNDYSDTYIDFLEWYCALSNQEKKNVDDELKEMLNKNYEYKDEERLEISY